MPWLYYLRDGRPRLGSEVLLQSGRVAFRASFDYVNADFGIVKSLRFKIASYDIYGNLLDFINLSDELFICETETTAAMKFFEIGNNKISTCFFDLSRLVSKKLYPK